MAWHSCSRQGSASRLPTCAVALAAFWAVCLLPVVLGKYVKNLDQGFFFNTAPPNQSPPVPTTAQCDAVHITWGRGAATGPNPTAPYFLQVFTSAFIVPFWISVGNSALEYDWEVPFIPGTQYQICMWDSNGVTGGCQATYTVYQSPNHTLANPPVCANVTYPPEGHVLGVDGFVDNGPISQYGWVDQCTDISLVPTNGTPPYTMTIAPSLHPPFIITSPTMDPINWTISLSWGMPFFISLSDSSGLMWANGPLHSGGGGTTTCLIGDAALPENGKIKPWVPAISAVAGLGFGLVVGFIGAVFLIRRRQTRELSHPDLSRKLSSPSLTIPILSSPQEQPQSNVAQSSENDGTLSRESSYRTDVSSHAMTSDFGVHSRQSTVSPTPTRTLSNAQSFSSVQSHTRSPSIGSVFSSPPPGQAMSQLPTVAEDARAPQHVYVVHHDAGRPPVTVYTADGAEVVELPPRYDEGDPAPTTQSSSRALPEAPASQGHHSSAIMPIKQPAARRVVN